MKPTTLIRMAVVIVLVAQFIAPVRGQAPNPVSAEERSAVVEQIGRTLVNRYVFPEVGEQCRAALLQHLSDGDFDGLTDPTQFAERLTEAVQAVSRDKHMRVRFRPPPPSEMQGEAPNPARARAEQRRAARRDNFGFDHVERLEGNVGYIEFRYFAGSPDARTAAGAAMAFLANADALIVDLRRNGGGNPDMVRFLCSYFFDEPTHLNSLYWREGDRTEDFWTLSDLPGPRLDDVPVFVLTSSYTFSGAEEFCYNLKTRDRATIVGETTGGGANPGGGVPIGDRFMMFVPMGRAINPITGDNWEGVGVTPHVEAAADDALDVALQLAQDAAEDRRERQQEALETSWRRFEEAQSHVRSLVEQGDRASAERSLLEAMDAALASGVIDELDINAMGYRELEQGETTMAIVIFRFNVQRFPESANVHDSLGEAYMNAGQSDRAIQSYRRSLELDPANENAKAMIKRMEEKSRNAG